MLRNTKSEFALKYLNNIYTYLEKLERLSMEKKLKWMWTTYLNKSEEEKRTSINDYNVFLFLLFSL